MIDSLCCLANLTSVTHTIQLQKHHSSHPFQIKGEEETYEIKLDLVAGVSDIPEIHTI